MNSLSPWDSPSPKSLTVSPPPEETKQSSILPHPQISPIPRSLKHHKIKINTSQSRSELSLLRFLIEKNSWKEVFGYEGDILWSGLAIPEENLSFATEILVNRIPGMPDLAHKKKTSYFLNKFQEYFPQNYDFYPKTFRYPEEESQFIDHFKKNVKKNKDKCYIAKPTSGCQGDGIFLIKSLNDLPGNRFSSPPELVIQEYIDNPLIIDDKKFDLRLYVVIAKVKPFIAFLADEGLARFATEDYQHISKENMRNYYMHLTNYSLNKLNSKYVFSEEITEIHKGSKRTLTSLWKSIEKKGIEKGEILEKIEELIVNFLKSMQPFMLFDYKTAFNGKDNGKCFHVLGFDILIDSDLKPWLLEINNNPSLNINHEDDTLNEKNCKKNNSFISIIDKFVKGKVVEDTILLQMLKKEEFSDIRLGDHFRSLKLIFNEAENQKLDEDLFKNILEIYGKLSGFRFKGSITASKFNKLAGISGMINEKFPKNSYDLLFTKVQRGQFDSKNMDFVGFLRAFEELAAKLIETYKEDDKFPGVSLLKERIMLEIVNL